MRAKRWITSPQTPCTKEKKVSFASDRLMEVADADPLWAIGFQDELWWSRVAMPTLSSFSEETKPDRLLQRSVAKDASPTPRPSPATGSICPDSVRRG
jgi:hypothetical protein